MRGRQVYDLVVVGAGPGGLSAARTGARLGFKTLVVERLPGPGGLGHPCSALIAPVPRQARLTGGLYFRKLDFSIPASMIVGYPAQQRWMSPTGFSFDASLSGRKTYPVAAIDKGALLRSMAGEAQAAGAELRFGVEVSGLLRDSRRVTGVVTGEGSVFGQMVLSAEGVTHELCRQALPFAHVAGPERYGLVASQEFEAPEIGAGQVGQYITLGRRYSSARNGFGMLVAPAPGRLTAFFCMFAEGPHHFTERSAHFYLQEYLSEDPRVRGLVAGARSLGEVVSRTMAGSAPLRVAVPGFMGIGDAITPAGYLGILPAVYLGRQAALVASEAIEAEDTSVGRLSYYEQLFRTRMLPELIAEFRILASLADMRDDELDGFCRSLGTHRSVLPFSAHSRSLEWETVGSRIRAVPAINLASQRAAVLAVA